MLGEPGVVGRALEREVERDLDAVLARGGDEARRSRPGARVRVDARCGRRRPSRSPTGCPGRPGRRRGCCCGPCGGCADRVDRRQVEHVEAELGEPRQRLSTPSKPAERAREQLVPGAEARGTLTGSTSIAVGSARGGVARRSARRVARARAAQRRRSRRRDRRPAINSPSDSSPARSACPACCLRRSSSCQSAKGRSTPRSPKSQWPSSLTTKSPSNRCRSSRDRPHRRLPSAGCRAA